MKGFVKWGASCLLLCVSALGWASDRQGAGENWSGVWRATDPQPLLHPTDGSAIPFKPKALALYNENLRRRARGDDAFDLTSKRCSSPGIPRILFMPGAFEILPTSGQISFAYEFNHLFRQVFISPSAPQALYPTVMGLEIGHWDGDQLVIETTSRSANTLLDDAIPNSEALHVVEHWRHRGALLEDQVTIDDPQMFEHPWTAVVHYRALPDYEIHEDICLDRIAEGGRAINWPVSHTPVRP